MREELDREKARVEQLDKRSQKLAKEVSEYQMRVQNAELVIAKKQEEIGEGVRTRNTLQQEKNHL